MTIDANTKINKLLRENPDALEAIISISPKFNKLRNPLLRKLIASRTSIAQASRIGGCRVDDFFEKLEPLGFSIDREAAAQQDSSATPIPPFMHDLRKEDILELDVRPILEAGQDPFSQILKKANELQARQALLIINNFDPIPLIELLGKRGFQTYTDILSPDLYHTYFYKADEVRMGGMEADKHTDGWEETLARYEGKMKEIDVRHMEMPMPMMTILSEIDELPEGHALYVNHKRVPLFLLPELQDKQFEYRVKEIAEGNVKMLIFKA